MDVGELPVKALSELAGGKAAYKLCVSSGFVRIAVDGHAALVVKQGD